MDDTRESHEMYGSTSSDDQGSVTTVIHVDRGTPAEQQQQRRQRQTGSSDDGGDCFQDGRRLSRRDRADDTSGDSDDDEHLMLPADRTAASDSDSDSTLSDTQDWVSRQSQTPSKPSVPPKPQSFLQSSVAPSGRRNVALRVSLASEGSGAVETVAIAEPTVRNGSCVPSPSDATIEILLPLPAMTTQGICPVDQTWTGVHVGSSLFQTISCLYAVLLVVVGLVLSFAEVSKPQPVLLLDVFEWFYVYLFGMSIVFLLYVCLVVMRRPPLHEGLVGNNVPIEGSILRRWSRRRNSETHAASFYLRLGAVGFGIGAMILEGLAFGQLFEDGIMSPCLDLTDVIRSVLQLTFTFVQLYTIVLSSTACLHKHTLSAYFAYMHMAATNACVWLRVVVMETMMDVTNGHINDAMPMHSSTSPTPTILLASTVVPPVGNYTHDSEIAQNVVTVADTRCPRIDLMGHVVRAASPYLYPCTVQYSLVAGGILCVTWYGISRCPLSQQSPVAEDETKIGTKVDCRGTHYGLFCGLFTLIATIIAVIVFFVFLDNTDLVVTATLMLYTLEGALCGLAVVALLGATILMSQMKCYPTKTLVLDELLLMLSVGGIYVYCGFSIVTGLYHVDSWPGLFLFLSCAIIVLQATFQTVFIRCSLHRSEGHRRGSDKPGRECITFLIVINIALWGVTLFERLRTDVSPTAHNFYGALLWSVITHITAPLCLFYRFHSAVCLANIWSSAYKVIT